MGEIERRTGESDASTAVSATTKAELFRLLPSVDDLLRRPEMHALVAREGHSATVDAARGLVDELRSQIAKGAMPA